MIKGFIIVTPILIRPILFQTQLLEQQTNKIDLNFNQSIFRKIDNFVLAEFLNELKKVNISSDGKCYGNSINTHYTEKIYNNLF